MAIAQVLDVSAWDVVAREPAGSGNNLWLRDHDGETWLFKANRVNNRGDEEGEDWAERLAHDVARLLGVPTAVVEVAERHGDGDREHGALSKNLITSAQRSTGWELQLGAVLLTGTDGFQVHRSDGTGRPPRDHVGHTPGNISAALRAVAPPPDGPPDLDASEVFTGYLVLDALIGNQDRHEENWGVIVDDEGRLSLAPSFDHAGSLGFQLTDAARTRHLQRSAGVEEFAMRAAGRKFEGGSTSLVRLAQEALDRGRPSARRFWLDQVGGLDADALRVQVQSVPRMSEVARTFCHELLLVNRRRLLDVRH